MANTKVFKDIFLYDLALFLAKKIIVLKELVDLIDLGIL